MTKKHKSIKYAAWEKGASQKPRVLNKYGDHAINGKISKRSGCS